jgi:hypothetical protein
MRALVAGAILAACIAAAATAAGAAPVRGCAERADSADPNPADTPTSDDLFVGRRILLVGARETKPWEVRLDSGWLWLKTLADVRRGRRVTLTVPRGERRRLKLNWSDARGARVSQTLAPCGDREWTYFPGGFLYSERGCYAIDIRIEGKPAVRKRIPLGKGATCQPSR